MNEISTDQHSPADATEPLTSELSQSGEPSTAPETTAAHTDGDHASHAREAELSRGDVGEGGDGHDAQQRPLSPLEEDGEVAADYIEELLDTADIDGDIDIEVRDGRTYVSVVAEEDDAELDALVGSQGEVLEALQELARLSVLSATDRRSRLVLDVAGYRVQRAEQLRELADEAVERARSTGEPVHLDPLSAFERKIVHDAVAEAGLHSESEGEGAQRHIVIRAEQ